MFYHWRARIFIFISLYIAGILQAKIFMFTFNLALIKAFIYKTCHPLPLPSNDRIFNTNTCVSYVKSIRTDLDHIISKRWTWMNITQQFISSIVIQIVDMWHRNVFIKLSSFYVYKHRTGEMPEVQDNLYIFCHSYFKMH